MQYSSTARRLALSVIGSMLVLSAAAGSARSDQVVNLLPNGGAEIAGESETVPAEWFAAMVPADGLTMARETGNAHRGESCLAISSQATYEEPVSNNWAQKLRYVPSGRTMRVRGWVRTEDAEAANICVQCWGPGGETLVAFASTEVIKGTTDWKRVTSERFVVPSETESIIVRAALTGKGRVWFDDMRLEVIGPKVVGDPGLAEAVSGRILKKLPLKKDAMVLAYMPDWRHGNVDNIGVNDNDGGVRTLIELPQPPTRLAGPNRKYLLAMYARETLGDAASNAIEMQLIRESWAELIGWKEQPKFSEEAAFKFDFVPGSGWKIFDVTDIVISKAAEPGAAHGVVLKFAKEDREAEKKNFSGYQFVSREGVGEWEAFRPMLLVVDPDQPAVKESKATATVVKAPALTTEHFLAYVEYLASLPDVEIRPVAGDVSAAGEASQQMWKAIQASNRSQLDPHAAHVRMHLLELPPHERFVAAYPLTPEGVKTMSGLLSWSYAQAEKKDAAERIAKAAAKLGAGTELAVLVEVNLASIEAILGKQDEAKARLVRVINQALPKTEDRRASDIRLMAPLKLADLLRDEGDYEAAERVYRREVIAGGTEWDKEHPGNTIGESYVVAAYHGLLAIAMHRSKEDADAVERLMKEAGERVPAAVAELQSSVEMMKDRQNSGPGSSPTEGDVGDAAKP
jgi:hypothetical protein